GPLSPRARVGCGLAHRAAGLRRDRDIAGTPALGRRRRPPRDRTRVVAAPRPAPQGRLAGQHTRRRGRARQPCGSTPVHRVVLSLTAAAATVVAAATTLHGQAPDAPGGIRGRVLLGAPAAAHAHRATLVDPPSPQADTAPEPPRAVVYLEVAPQLAFEDVRPGRARLDQRGERFVPHVLAIRAGTTVDFPNN